VIVGLFDGLEVRLNLGVKEFGPRPPVGNGFAIRWERLEGVVKGIVVVVVQSHFNGGTDFLDELMRLVTDEDGGGAGALAMDCGGQGIGVVGRCQVGLEEGLAGGLVRASRVATPEDSPLVAR